MLRKLTVLTLTSLIGVSAFLGLADTASNGPGQTAQADEAKLREGDMVPTGKAKLIERPGLYGLGPEQPGSRYAVVEGKLVRLDAKTLKILSILRQDAEASR